MKLCCLKAELKDMNDVVNDIMRGVNSRYYEYVTHSQIISIWVLVEVRCLSVKISAISLEMFTWPSFHSSSLHAVEFISSAEHFESSEGHQECLCRGHPTQNPAFENPIFKLKFYSISSEDWCSPGELVSFHMPVVSGRNDLTLKDILPIRGGKFHSEFLVFCKTKVVMGRSIYT